MQYSFFATFVISFLLITCLFIHFFHGHLYLFIHLFLFKNSKIGLNQPLVSLFIPFQFDEYDDRAKFAYQALLTFMLYQPDNDKFRDFIRTHDLRQEKDYNFLRPPGESVSMILTMESPILQNYTKPFLKDRVYKALE